jgi:hypothetical protein
MGTRSFAHRNELRDWWLLFYWNIWETKGRGSANQFSYILTDDNNLWDSLL